MADPIPPTESGLPSAVGLCLESEHRKVPMTADQVGVANTNPHRFFIVEAGGGFPVRPNINVPNDEIDGDLELKRTIKTSNGNYAGTFGFKMDGENVYYPLLGYFGRDLQSVMFRIDKKDVVSGGTFTVSLDFGGGAEVTGPLAYNIALDAFITAIEGLTNVGADKVSIVGTAGGPYTLTFDPSLGSALVVIVDDALVTGGGTLTAGDIAFKHEFIVNPKGFKPSFVSEEIFGSSKNNGRLTSGVLVDRLQHDLNEILLCRMNLSGFRQIPNEYRDETGTKREYDYTSDDGPLPVQMGGADGLATTIKRTTTPTYIDVEPTGSGNGPWVFADMVNGSAIPTAFMAINDDPKTDVQIQPNIQFTFQQQVQVGQTGGSGYDNGSATGNAFETTGTMNLLYQDNMIPLATLKKSKVAFNFKFLGSDIPDTNIPYSLEYHVPKARFLEGGVEMPASQMLSGGNWVAEKDMTLGYAIKVTVVNSVDNSQLGGDAGTTGEAGGLGGWNNE